MTLLDRLTSAMAALNDDPARGIELLADLYASDMRFSGPLQSVQGRDEFLAMMHRMTASARELRFERQHGAETADALYLGWYLTLRTRSLRAPLRVEGMTHCVVREGRIVEQRDYWDLLGSGADALPMAGIVLKKLIAQFAM